MPECEAGAVYLAQGQLRGIAPAPAKHRPGQWVCEAWLSQDLARERVRALRAAVRRLRRLYRRIWRAEIARAPSDSDDIRHLRVMGKLQRVRAQWRRRVGDPYLSIYSFYSLVRVSVRDRRGHDRRPSEGAPEMTHGTSGA